MKSKRMIAFFLAVLMAAVLLSFASLTVIAAEEIPGDLNGDSYVNTTDVVSLRRFVAGGYGVTMDEREADLNADGYVNTSDVVLLRRYIAGGYGVELKPAPEQGCDHIEIIDKAVMPTCIQSGLTEGKHCSKCGEVLLKQEVVPAIGHTEEIIPGKAATCTAMGLTEGKKCSVCGEILIAQKTISAKGHTEKIVPGKVATCTSSGLSDGKKCVTCGEILVAQSVLPAKGHSSVDGVCTVCGNGGETPEEFFTFTLQDDGTYSIKAKDVNNMPAEVVIPASYQGKAVTCIEYAAFYGCTSLFSVIIPDGVDIIGGAAFASCSALTSVFIPEGVTEICDFAFERCDSIETIRIPSSLAVLGEGALPLNMKNPIEYGNGLYVGNEANPYLVLVSGRNDRFSDFVIHTDTKFVTHIDCWKLKTIHIPANVISIEEGSFVSAGSLVQITVDEDNSNYHVFGNCLIETESKTLIAGWGADIPADGSVTAIAPWAFRDCVGLTKLDLPEGLVSIGYYAFLRCSNLTSINIPDGVTSIGYSAFSDCNSLTSITIPDGVTRINRRMFYDCNSLTSITIPSSLIGIKDDAFENCDSLTTVNYCGSSSEWERINISSGNNELLNATINFNYKGENNDPVECLHTDKVFVAYIYEDITYVNTVSHSVKVISQYKCKDCKEIITDTGNAVVKTEDHIPDFEVNGGWVCRCGHIQDVAFEAYKANLQSDVNQTTYFDPVLTVRHGTVYISDEITVIGSTDGAYLIKYPLDAGGYKYAFIAKKYIDTQTYIKESKLDVFVNGKTVSAVNNNEKIFVNLKELMNAFGEEADFIICQSGYNVTFKVRNTKTKEYYNLSIDLEDYLSKNWTNVYAVKAGETGNVPGFCIGAYVYTGDIFIELQELMDLLEYQCEENCYVPSDFTVNLRLYSNALNVLNGGAYFDAQYESLRSENDGRIRSLLYHFLTFDWGDMISSNDYYTDEELVEAIKQMLYDRSYPVDTSQIECGYEIMQAIGGLLSMLEDGSNAIGMTMGEWEYRFAAILKEDGFGDLFGNLKICCNNFKEKMDTAGNVIDNFEFANLMIEEVVVMATLQFQYDENMAVLELLIENETDPKVIAVYEKVRKELMAYYAGQATGVFHTWTTNREIRNKAVEGLVDFAVEKSKDGFMKKTALSNPYYVAYEITCFLANEVFNGEKIYDAQDGIYRIHNTLELYIPSLNNAVEDYYDNPIPNNTDRLIAIAVIAANLRIQAADYCIDYVGSKVFHNDTEMFEMEKRALELALQNIKDIFAELS